MEKLSKMVTDGTYDQGSQAMRVAKMTNHESHSYDLSSATDRFPMKILKLLVSNILGENGASHWERVMVLRDFSIKGGNVRWVAGQPLGFYSS